MEYLETLTKLPLSFEIQKLHPALVHFPIALLFMSLVFYIFAASKKSKGAELVALSNMIAGTLISYAAVYTGLLAEHAVKQTPAVHEFVELHEKLGWGVAGFFTLMSLWGLISYRRPGGRIIPLFLILILIGGIALGIQSYLGGYLVYDAALGVKK
ncbi:MAG TPA: DUF2231 domain-containing protein [Acidobacteriota bacterium]|jgi:uncharacterized membrane protein|nr:DUF2231 domain-containing protein [Acidobacteriota bacterium]